MSKMTEITPSESRKKWTPEKLAELAKQNPPEFPSGITDGDRKSGQTPVVGRGFAVLKDHINRNGRPKAEDPKVSISIRIPLSRAEALRMTGPGWQTRTSALIVKNIDKGKLSPQGLPQKRA